MKISGKVIQDRNVSVSNENTFGATYKGKLILVTSYHSYGEAKYKHLVRYAFSVVDKRTNKIEVNDYGDYHEIKDAIRVALVSAKLL